MPGAVRSRQRRAAAKLVLVAVVALQATLLIRAGSDPHKLFGFRPFNESDTWSAEIVRLTAQGERRAVDDGTWEYDWDELVDNRKLRGLGRTHHAAAGADAIVDFLDRSLDWVLDNVPDDRSTVALEATVTVHRNAGGPEVIVLRSERDERR